MIDVELFVGLLVPDNTSLTVFHTLEKLGFKELKSLEREDYYRFTVDQSYNEFKKAIAGVDILINKNKHSFYTKKSVESFDEKKRNDFAIVRVLVQDKEDGSTGILATLQNRLDFRQIKTMKKGTLWTMGFVAHDKNHAEQLAKRIAEQLLYNEHYQECKIL